MNKARFLLFLALAAASSAVSQETYSLWTRYRVLTLNTTNANGGANVNGNARNVPVLVRLSSAQADVFAGALPGGADLRFTKSDGVTRLSHQIEAWDSAANTARVWVRLDTAYAQDSTQSFRLYWGKSGVVDSSRSASVFRTADGYQGVWHFENNLNDATSNGYNGTNTNSADSAGFHGRGRYFNGSNASIALGAAPAMATGNSLSFSIEAWVKWQTIGVDPSATKYRTIMNRGQSGSAGDQLVFYARNPTSAGVYNPYYSFGYFTGSSQSNVSNDARDSGIADDANRWVHLTATYSGATWRIYTNGYLAATTTRTNTLPTSTSNWFIGSYGSSERSFHGTLDEIRFSTVQRDSNFVRLSYAVQKDTVTALKMGATQSSAPSNLSYPINPANYVVGVPVTPNVPTVLGLVDSFTIAPVLPSGLVFSASTGGISGMPSMFAAPADYVITAHNSAGTGKDTLALSVSAAPPSAPTLAYAQASATLNVGTAASGLSPVLGGGAVDSLTISPALPAGLLFNKNTGVISGAPSVTAAATAHVITAINAGGTAKDTVTLTVLPAGPSNLVYPVQIARYTLNKPIAPNVPSVSGTVDSFTVAPALPAGLVFTKSTGAISGAATAVSEAANYVVTAANAGGLARDTLNIAVDSAENYFTWSQHRTLTLNTTSSGAAVTANVRNFPVLVRLDSASFKGVSPLAGGADLRFTKAGDLIRLEHQIEAWDSVTKSAGVWVRVDTVYGNNATQQIRMHWGKAGAQSMSSGPAVFDTAAAFQAVWHFGEAGSDSAFDATANRLNAAAQRTSSGVGFPAAAAGAVGSAREFGVGVASGNATGGYFTVANSATGPINFPQNGNFTVSTWASVDAVGTSRTLFSKSDKQYSMELRQTGAEWEFSEFQGGGGWQAVNEIATAATWTHLVGVRAGINEYLYVNGVLVDSEIRLDASSAARRAVNFEIGRSPDGATGDVARYYYDGKLDEIRLESAARDMHWIKLSYANQKSGQNLVVMDSDPVSIGAARLATSRGPGSLSIKASGAGLMFQVRDVAASEARLELFDMRGQSVWSAVFPAGANRIAWNGAIRNGAAAPAGIYVARVTISDASGAARVLERTVPFTR